MSRDYTTDESKVLSVSRRNPAWSKDEDFLRDTVSLKCLVVILSGQRN